MATKPKTKVSQASRRAARTGTQVGIPGLLIATLARFDLINWTPEQTVSVLALATALFSLVQNVLERRYGRDFLIRKG